MNIRLDILQVVVAACTDIAFALLVGMLLAERAVAGSERAQASVRHNLRVVGLSAATVLLAAQWLSLWLQSAVLTGLPLSDVSSQLLTVVTDSHYGSAWLIGYLAVLVLFAVLLTHFVRGRASADVVGLPPGMWLAASISTALLALTRSAVSHAADGGDLSLAECVHCLHLCASAAWAGLILASAWSVLPVWRTQATRAQQLSYVNGLSHSAGAAFLVALAAGAFNTWHESDDDGAALLTSAWTHILIFKLVLIGCALGCAGYNRVLNLPRLRRDAQALNTDLTAQDAFDLAYQSYTRWLTLQALLLLGVLAIAAFLGQNVPGV